MFDIGEHVDNKFLHATIVNRYRDSNGIKTYDCRCDKCGCTSPKPENQVVKGIGCGVCAGRIVVKGINDIPTTAPWMIPYFLGGEEEASKYTKNSGKKFTPICPFCGRISDVQTSPNNLERLNGISCICKDGISVPNKVVRALMEQAHKLGLISSYNKEYKEIDEKGVTRKFDMSFFDLDGNHYFVEMDGGYHGEVIRKHSNKKFVAVPAKLFYPDIMKDNIAERLGIPLIRIDCYKSDLDYIKNNIYSSELSRLINLDKIDWIALGRVCSGNIMTDVCKRKADNPDITAQEVAEEFDISPYSVRNYWNQGTKLGLCYYDSKVEGKKWTQTKEEWTQGVHIIVEKNNDELHWEFPTIAEFIRNAEEIFSSKFTKRMFERRFEKTDNNYVIYESPVTKDSFKIIRLNKEEN